METHWPSKGATGHVPPIFFEEGAQCYEEMYLDLSITSDDNAGQMVRTISQEEELGWCPHSIKIISSVTYEKCMHALRLHQT